MVHGKGYNSVGKYCIRTPDGKYSTSYETWRGMLRRCYSKEYQEKHPSYKGCYVCGSWLDFQVFAAWCETQIGFNVEGYQLDKDLLSKGNKEYSEKHCVFLPKQINTFILDNKQIRGECPIGVYLVGDKYRVQIRVPFSNSRKQKFLGMYSNKQEAFMRYKAAKEDIARELAKALIGKVEHSVLLALQNYTVCEGD